MKRFLFLFLIFNILFINNCLAGIDLNGDADYVSLGDTADYSPTDLTIACWVNGDTFTSTNGTRYWIATKGTSGGGNYEWGLFIRGNGVIAALRMTIWNTADGGYLSADSTTTVSNNAWHHLCGTYDNGTTTVTAYLDGTAEGTVNTPTGTKTGDRAVNLLIGDRADGGTNNLNAQVAECALWKTDLSATEVAILASSRLKRLPLQIQPASLVGYWALDDYAAGQSTVSGLTFVNMSSGNGNDGTGVDADNDSDTVSETLLSYP